MNDAPARGSVADVRGACVEVDRLPGMEPDSKLAADGTIDHGRCMKPFQRASKRGMDVVISALSLIALSPLMILTAVATKLMSQGPIFYRWDVIGRNGVPFSGYKFRTMVVGADEMKKSLSHLNEMTGPVFKITRDPRVTLVGKIIRKYSIDEFPQLWTVLRGDMSLVGPRPVGLHEWDGLEEWQRRKLSVTPGMICLWHVNGKPKDFDQWVKMDLEYIDRWSLWLDIKILAKGALYILLGKSC